MFIQNSAQARKRPRDNEFNGALPGPVNANIRDPFDSASAALKRSRAAWGAAAKESEQEAGECADVVVPPPQQPSPQLPPPVRDFREKDTDRDRFNGRSYAQGPGSGSGLSSTGAPPTGYRSNTGSGRSSDLGGVSSSGGGGGGGGSGYASSSSLASSGGAGGHRRYHPGGAPVTGSGASSSSSSSLGGGGGPPSSAYGGFRGQGQEQGPPLSSSTMGRGGSRDRDG